MFFECMLCSFQKEGSESKCPKHGTLRYRLHPEKVKRYNRINIDGSSRGNGRWSKTMGINPNQIEEFKKHYPDRTYHPQTGDLWIEHRQHKKRLLKEQHLSELD